MFECVLGLMTQAKFAQWLALKVGWVLFKIIDTLFPIPVRKCICEYLNRSFRNSIT